MTRKDIIRMAGEAGLIHYHDSEGHWTGVTNDNLIDVEENRWDDKLVRILEPFAALVAEAERRRCAADVYNALLEVGQPEGIRKVAVDAVLFGVIDP